MSKGIYVGGKPVSGIHVGSTPVREVRVGAELVWPTAREVVRLTEGNAYTELRTALAVRGHNWRTVTELPFDLDTSQVKNLGALFYEFAGLVSVPDIDTSSATVAYSLYDGCVSLRSVPEMDTSQVTDMQTMFFECVSLRFVPEMDTSRVTHMQYMFDGCSSLTDGNVRLIRRDGTLPQARTGMIDGSGLTREPFFDSSGRPIP